MNPHRISIEHMTCERCSTKIEAALQDIDGAAPTIRYAAGRGIT